VVKSCISELRRVITGGFGWQCSLKCKVIFGRDLIVLVRKNQKGHHFIRVPRIFLCSLTSWDGDARAPQVDNYVSLQRVFLLCWNTIIKLFKTKTMFWQIICSLILNIASKIFPKCRNWYWIVFICYSA